MPRMGFEPTRDCSHTHLKRTCLPFHHLGKYALLYMFLYVYPSCYASGVWLVLMNSHIYHSTTWAHEDYNKFQFFSIKKLSLFKKRASFFMVPRKRLELLHREATASKTVVSTIPPPGHIQCQGL